MAAPFRFDIVVTVKQASNGLYFTKCNVLPMIVGSMDRAKLDGLIADGVEWLRSVIEELSEEELEALLKQRGVSYTRAAEASPPTTLRIPMVVGG